VSFSPPPGGCLQFSPLVRFSSFRRSAAPLRLAFSVSPEANLFVQRWLISHVYVAWKSLFQAVDICEFFFRVASPSAPFARDASHRTKSLFDVHGSIRPTCWRLLAPAQYFIYGLLVGTSLAKPYSHDFFPSQVAGDLEGQSLVAGVLYARGTSGVSFRSSRPPHPSVTPGLFFLGAKPPQVSRPVPLFFLLLPLPQRKMCFM